MTYPLILIKRVFFKSVLKIFIILIEQDCPEAVVHALGKSLGELVTEQFRVHEFLLFFICILSRI